MLRLFPWITLAVFIAPIIAGLIGTLLPAFGILPALGGNAFSLEPWRRLLAAPGILHSMELTVSVGFLATFFTFFLTMGFCAVAHPYAWFKRIQAFLSPLLAAPHAATAIGLAFLLAPSGWLARMVSPWATGWDIPPDVAIVRDSLGLSFVAGLLLKEVPYLLLMTLGAMGQVRQRQTLVLARSLGYGPAAAWLKTVFPQIYPQIRLPIYAVLAFSLSVVDVAIILAPTNPPPLAVQVLRFFHDRDLAWQFPGAAGAILQLVIVIMGICCWRILEIAIARLFRGSLIDGHRGRGRHPVWTGMFTGSAFLIGLLSVLGAAALAVWSMVRVWRYPDALPSKWTMANWTRNIENLAWPTWNTVSVGLAAVAIAMILSIGCLENEKKYGIRPVSRGMWILYTPLLIPKIGFLFGAQTLLIRLGIDGVWGSVVWSHLLFVTPYVFLSLADPWRALDDRYPRTAACLGVSPFRILYRVKLPMLLRPVLFALAIGFAVSVAQYLPTMFAGGGRFPTLTTEAVTLTSGSDRRIIGVYAFVQTALPLAVYAMAIALPAWIHRDRRDMRVR